MSFGSRRSCKSDVNKACIPHEQSQSENVDCVVRVLNKVSTPYGPVDPILSSRHRHRVVFDENAGKNKNKIGLEINKKLN